MRWSGWVVAVLAVATALPAAADREASEALAAWARVLDTFVNEAGEVDFAALAEDRAELDAYVDYVSRSGPQSRPAAFPDRAEVLAHHLNAYNAVSMHAVIEAGIPESLGGLRGLWFFRVANRRIGGRDITLSAYENDVIRPLGEPRVHFALNCMSVGCPRLPRTPFTAGELEAELERAAREFFAEPRNVEVDHERGVVRLSEILDFYAEDFLAESPSLLAYVNRYRDPPIPEDQAIEFIPYDWTVNRQR
jgi:hypothetical protein